MKTAIVGIAALLTGVFLGTAVHPFSVRAQYVPRANVYVEEVRVGGSKGLLGTQVVGFSCVVTDGDTHCFAASVHN
jgi:hypothetical protein